MIIDLAVRVADADDAATMTDLIHRAFAGRPPLDPPSTALDETPETVASALAAAGGIVATVDGHPAGSMIFAAGASDGVAMLGLRRVSVLPQWQGRGVATAMVGVAEDVARRRGLGGVSLVARRELTATVEFWRRRGYLVDEESRRADRPELAMRKHFDPGILVVDVATPADMHTLGRVLAGELAAGDLVLLIGDLGAGKTTLTQGIGSGLEVAGQVTSPTFVISRVHRATGQRPPLVHVDAYRLASGAEFDDLDLDSVAETGVTVVEWGGGMAESMSEDRLVLELTRLPAADGTDNTDGIDSADTADTADTADSSREPVDPRTVSLRAVGARWSGEVLHRIVHRYRSYTQASAEQP